jgi:hypothetical protein
VTSGVVFGVLYLCLGAAFWVTGAVTPLAARVPGRGWILAGWRAYPPRRAGLGMIGVGAVWVLLGLAGILGHGWPLAVLALVCLALLALFVGWLVRTWRRSNRV